MHLASLLGELRHDQKASGWSVSDNGHDWEKMVIKIQAHIKLINFEYKGKLI